MTSFFTSHRQMNAFSSKENRLCRMTSGPDIVPTGAAVADWLSENVAKPLGTMKDATVKYLSDAWHGAETPEQRKELSQVVEFLRSVPPSFSTLIEKVITEKRLDSAQIVKLASHQEWIKAFKATDLDVPKDNAAADTADKATPENILKTLDEVTRKDLFFDYVRGMVGDKTMTGGKFDNVFGPSNVPADARAQRIEKMLVKRGKILDAVSLMIGEDVPGADKDSKDLADNSLEQRFYQDGDRRKPMLSNGVEEYKRVLKANPGRTRADDLEQPAVLPPMLFKGALRRGVIEDRDLATLRGENGVIDAQAANRMRRVQSGSQEMNALTKVADREMREKAQGLSDVWEELPGWQKAVLISGLVYAGIKLKGWAVAIGAVYFGAKFMGVESPGEGLFSFGKDMIGKIPGGKGLLAGQKLTARDIEQQADIMSRFLGDNARERNDASVQGFVLLSYVPMQTLAQHFEAVPPPAHLQMTPQFRKELKMIFEKRGMDKAAVDKFFDVCTNRPLEVSDALLTAFFVAGKSSPDPAIREAAFLVEQELGNLPGGSHDVGLLLKQNPVVRTRDGNEFHVAELYMKVSAYGQQLAKAMGNKTLLEFVHESSSGNHGVAKQEQQAKDEAEKIEAKKKLLTEMEQKIRNLPEVRGPMYGGQFDVTLDGSMVRYGNGMPATALNRGVTPFDVFSKATPQTIFDKYSRWMARVGRPATDTDPLK